MVLLHYNNSSDRHANKNKTYRHHAILAVNAAMTLVNFLLNSKDYQKIKADNKTN